LTPLHVAQWATDKISRPGVKLANLTLSCSNLKGRIFRRKNENEKLKKDQELPEKTESLI
jgi:hypothetical protein